MNLVSSIEQLDYYITPADGFCYCEHLIYPSDCILQDNIPAVNGSILTYKVFLMSPDGLTEHEEVTTNFDFTAFSVGGVLKYNLKLLNYSDLMCSLTCWILRVEIYSSSTLVYKKWTNKYCQVDCCITPTDVTPVPVNCDVFVNNIQKIYKYDPLTDVSTLVYSGTADFSDLATIGDKLYARDGFTGNISVFQWTGTTLTPLSVITSMPVGAALGADDTYLYLDDGNTIKRLNLTNNTLTTVVASLGGDAVQGDILISGTDIIVTQDNGVGGSMIVIYSGGTPSATYDPLVDTGGNAVDDVYGMFYANNELHLMTKVGKIYTYDFTNVEATLITSSLQGINANSRWNGSAQNYGCESGYKSERAYKPATSVTVPRGLCGTPLLRIEVQFDCLDNQTGEYYGFPTNVLSGSAGFPFYKVINIPGTIMQMPREITRQIAYNCTLQRSESAKQYKVESVGIQGVFPAWKLNELEGMFHAPKITVSDFDTSRDYQFGGGVIANEIYPCWELYRLGLTLQSCTVRQTFGCNDGCDSVSAAKTFIIPENYKGGNFFTEEKTYIGDYDDLLNYFAGYGSVTETDYLNTYAAFSVSANGYAPTSFYYDTTSSKNRVYGTKTPNEVVIVCQQPVLGTAQSYDLTCETPVLGTVEIMDSPDYTASIAGRYDWVLSGESVNITDIWGKITFTATNSVLADDTSVGNTPIGVLSANAIPSTFQTFTNEDNASIPVGGYLSVDTYGVVSYSGDTFTSVDPVTLTITDLYYRL